MNFTTAAFLHSGALFICMLACLEVGRRLGIRRLSTDPEWGLAGLGVVEGAVFGLYGLLLAFTFSGAPARLDQRKQLIAGEANAIGTAYLRLDLLPPASQPAMRELFRKYTDSRLEIYHRSYDTRSARESLTGSSKLQREIWVQALAATRLQGSHEDAAKLLLPALNQMMDITTRRTTAALTHPPPVIFYLLIFVLALVCSVLTGYGMGRGKRRSLLHIAAFAIVTAICVYSFLEIEYPRLGLLRLLGTSDQLLVEQRDLMY